MEPRGPLLTLKCGDSVLEIWQGDITKLEIEAIVNPANSLMIMGGGVAGAIRRAGGDEVEAEARRHAPVPVGKAVVTSAGRLQPRIRYVIHAPTMERPAMRTTREKVKRATRAAIEAALEKGINSIALPAMGAGVGGLSIEDSAEAMLDAIEEVYREKGRLPSRIILIGYTDADARKMVEVVKRRMSRQSTCFTSA